jgi:hypothetical protein
MLPLLSRRQAIAPLMTRNDWYQSAQACVLQESVMARERKRLAARSTHECCLYLYSLFIQIYLTEESGGKKNHLSTSTLAVRTASTWRAAEDRARCVFRTWA